MCIRDRGCSPGMRRFFNPKIYRIILFDQRGCGRSKPHASIEANTTWHLVSDIEKIRKLLQIKSWIVFGGSWGATLALIYAQSHPIAVKHLVLRGVFLMTDLELDWFYNGGAGMFFPDEWRKLIDLLKPGEQVDVINSYNKKLFQEDEAEQTKYARAWTEWETALATMNAKSLNSVTPGEYARAFARIENHYFVNKGFLDNENQLLDNIDIIRNIPSIIIQGRYDVCTPLTTAWELHKNWPEAKFIITPFSGHSAFENEITNELINATNSFGFKK